MYYWRNKVKLKKRLTLLIDKHRNTKRKFLLVLFLFLFVYGCANKSAFNYGVFLGINEDEVEKLKLYQLVVIEPSEFTITTIENLHIDGKTVYGYLNIGLVEEYREYYARFKEIFLGVYQNWPDEQWVDVSAINWQSFIIEELAKQYLDLGIDGFFLDNTDVYYNYPTEEVYQGLCAILKGLKKYNVPLIINGGDIFVTRCIKDKIALSLFDGINQETVFTAVDFDNQSFYTQSEDETEYFKEYLKKAKENGLTVYLLEYGASRNLSKEIDDYCLENGFYWYNANNLDLK
jgi:hypothetical protein